VSSKCEVHAGGSQCEPCITNCVVSQTQSVLRGAAAKCSVMAFKSHATH